MEHRLQLSGSRTCSGGSVQPAAAAMAHHAVLKAQCTDCYSAGRIGDARQAVHYMDLRRPMVGDAREWGLKERVRCQHKTSRVVPSPRHVGIAHVVVAAAGAWDWDADADGDACSTTATCASSSCTCFPTARGTGTRSLRLWRSVLVAAIARARV